MQCLCVMTTCARPQAAQQARAGELDAASSMFDTDIVGASGAGFDHCRLTGLPLTDADALTSLALPSASLARQRAQVLAHAASDSRDGGGGGADAEGEAEALERVASGDAEALFKKEVEETLLRAMLLGEESAAAHAAMADNAVIELNALKIAGVLGCLCRFGCYVFMLADSLAIAPATVCSAMLVGWHSRA